MKHSHLRFPCLIAALYFGISVSGQDVRQDTTLKEKNRRSSSDRLWIG